LLLLFLLYWTQSARVYWLPSQAYNANGGVNIFSHIWQSLCAGPWSQLWKTINHI